MVTDSLRKALDASAAGKGWTILRAIQTHAGGDGMVPHGFALIERRHFPFKGKPYATLGWYDQPLMGVGFEQGHYDLTWEEALIDLDARVKR
jgi:hypothetical protein